jgi:2'-5' RNA ligase
VSPLPTHMSDRWDRRADPRPDVGVVYWHILLGHNSQVCSLALVAQRRLAEFRDLHMTPVRWLHITVLVAGSTDEFDRNAMGDMLRCATESLSHTPPTTVEIGRLLYHPEAVMVAVTPRHTLRPILDAARAATRDVTGRDGVVNGGSGSDWTPHITICYSTGRQPAEPIIAALGKSLPKSEITVDALSLVVQRGAERLWDWHPVGTVRLATAAGA